MPQPLGDVKREQTQNSPITPDEAFYPSFPAVTTVAAESDELVQSQHSPVTPPEIKIEQAGEQEAAQSEASELTFGDMLFLDMACNSICLLDEMAVDEDFEHAIFTTLSMTLGQCQCQC